MPQRVAIIGSGFLGMTMALRLAERGIDVTIFERADRIGGLAASWQIGDVEWDKHYHVTLASDSFTRKIVGELGLADDFKWAETKTGFFTDGKLYSMSDILEFLKFPPLDLISKLRLGATIFHASRRKDWKALEKISVEEWLTKLSGRHTFEKMWRPLLKAKLGDGYQETSAAFIWATIQRMYAARNSGMKKELFGYVRGGYAAVLKRFSEVLLERGVEIRLNSRIEKIEKIEGGKIRILAAAARRNGDLKESVLKNRPASAERAKYATVRTSISVAPGYSGMFLSEPASKDGNYPDPRYPASGDVFGQVILTCPSDTAANLLPQLTTHEKARLNGIRYQGIVCASVLMKCSMSRFYVTNITDESPFTGVIEMSALVDKNEFGHNALVYLPKYVASDDELFERSDDEIRTKFFAGLERMYPHFRRKDVLAFNVSRVRHVFPLPVLNYSESVLPVKTSIDNVYVVNSSHILNGTLNVNETIQLAEKTIKEISGF